MPYFSLDHCIVYASLLITLLVGLWAGRGIKTIREYATADKMFGTTALVLTFLATNLAGSDITIDGGLMISDGIIAFVAFLGFRVAYLITGTFIAPNIVHFTTCFTLGDIMKQLYGPYSGIVAGILGLLGVTLFAGVELAALGIIGEETLGIKASSGILLGGLLLTVYSAHGGIKAVVTTDILQFLIMAVGLPLVTYIAVHHAGGIQALVTQLPAEKLAILNHEKLTYYAFHFVFWSVFPVFLVDAALIQRLLMGRTGRQLRNQYFISATFEFFFLIMTLLIGLAGLVLYPTTEPNQIALTLINQLLPIGIKGLAIAGIVSLSMATIDSFLHAAGLTLIHDVIKPLCDQRGLSIASEKEKKWAQIATLVIGVMAICIGLSTTDIFGLFLDSLEATGPILLFPLFTGILGLKPEKKAFYTALAVTIAVWGACKAFLPESYSYLTTLISILANGITFLSVHWRMNKGFKRAKRDIIKPASAFQEKSNTAYGRILRQIMATPSCILHYAKTRVERYGVDYVLGGVLCFIHSTLPHFVGYPVMGHDLRCLFVLHIIGITLCSFLMIKDKWAQRWQHRYLPAFFYTTLFFCLPFLSTLVFLASQGEVAWLMHLYLSLFFLLFLVDWRSAAWIGTLGIMSGLLVYQGLTHCGSLGHFFALHGKLHLSSASFYLMGYQLLVGLLVTLLFVRKKQQQVELLDEQKQHLLQTYTLSEQDRLYQLRYQALQKNALADQPELLPWVKKALCVLQQANPEQAKIAQQAIEQLDNFLIFYKGTFYHSMDHLRLQVTTLSVETLLCQLAKALKAEGMQDVVQVYNQTQHTSITCDSATLVYLLVTTLRMTPGLTRSKPVSLWLQDTALAYSLQALPGYTRQIPAMGFVLSSSGSPIALRAVYPGHGAAAEIRIPKTITELPYHKSERILEAHFGYRHVLDKPAGVLLVLPVDLRAIRPQVVDQEPIPDPGRLENEQTLALEKAFLQQVQEQAVLDGSIVQDVIAHIKKVHQGQLRKSGDLFYTHPICVAQRLLTMTQDPDALVAALLHDTVEDTPVQIDQLRYRYGYQVALIVGKLTHLDPTAKKMQLNEVENQRQLAAARDARVVMIKLADRWHNVGTMQALHPKRQRAIAQETLDFYVPLGRGLQSTAVDAVVEEIIAQCQAILASAGA